jgi:hypothetical protein
VENERERACRSVGVEAVAADLLFLFRTLAFVGFFFILFWTDEWVETEARRVPPCRLDAAV